MRSRWEGEEEEMAETMVRSGDIGQVGRRQCCSSEELLVRKPAKQHGSKEEETANAERSRRQLNELRVRPAKRRSCMTEDAKAQTASSSGGLGGGAAVGEDGEQRHGPPGHRLGAVMPTRKSAR
ncbi:hypothetical protein Syun_020748 [Stephania yunnanensis]|uniref:Uncharacterized protein n=1 Tax=Stephania yunnanensis TaxID=152371 RepID=A0AAP0NRQ1_9MAGN